MAPIAGLKAVTIGDLAEVDLAVINSTPLHDLLRLMRSYGYDTAGINSVTAAAMRLVERGKIVLGD